MLSTTVKSLTDLLKFYIKIKELLGRFETRKGKTFFSTRCTSIENAITCS